MFDFLGEPLFWAALSISNLAASILIYHSTKLEQKQKLEFEYGLSTRPLPKSTVSLPTSFTYLSVLTGIINTIGALLRFQQIHLLEIPSIPWRALLFPNTEGHEEFLELLNAEIVVAFNDWSSLFMCLTFLSAGLFNFATARQLRLRDQWVKRVLLPVPVVVASRPNWYEDDKDMSELPQGLAIERPNLDGFKDEELGSLTAITPLCGTRGV